MRSSGSFSPLVNAKSLILKSPTIGVTPAIGVGAAGAAPGAAVAGAAGAGGFGAIYRATDVLSDAQVALKVLLPRLARDPMVVARFRREGETLATLRDPHTITAYEFGEAPDGTLYIVMELLHGESLYTRFRVNGALPWRRVITIARAVCSSLTEAHALGIIHRDLKPTNIHLEPRDNGEDF